MPLLLGMPIESAVCLMVADTISMKKIRRLFGWWRWGTFWECLYKPKWRRELEDFVDRELIATVLATVYVSGVASEIECNRAVLELAKIDYMQFLLRCNSDYECYEYLVESTFV